MDPQLEYHDVFGSSWCDSSLSSCSDPTVDAAADSWFPNYGSFAYQSDSGSYHGQSSTTSATYGRASTTHVPQLVPTGLGSSWNSEIPSSISPNNPNPFSDAIGSSWVSTSVSEASTPSAAKPDLSGQPLAEKQPRIAQSSRKHQQRLLPRLSPVAAEEKPKSAHSVVERRYRGKLNDKIVQLHEALLTSQLTKRSAHDTHPRMKVHVPPQTFNSRVGKAGIMSMAIDYVQQAEVQFQQLTDEIELLERHVVHLESLVPPYTTRS